MATPTFAPAASEDPGRFVCPITRPALPGARLRLTAPRAQPAALSLALALRSEKPLSFGTTQRGVTVEPPPSTPPVPGSPLPVPEVGAGSDVGVEVGVVVVPPPSSAGGVTGRWTVQVCVAGVASTLPAWSLAL